MSQPHQRFAPQSIILASIVANVLAVPVLGCVPTGRGCEDGPMMSTQRNTYEAELTAAELAEVRSSEQTPEERCAYACELIGGSDGEILACEAKASAASPADPWDVAHDSVTVECEVEEISEVYCEGRRPHGHIEAVLPVRSQAQWFAVHAHLERASVRAFEELAEWLTHARAPIDLVGRCLAAASDEVRHATLMTTWAERLGAAVPPCEVSETDRHILAVAIHNAVEGCVFESFAALMAYHQAEHAATPDLRSLFSSIAVDELRHGQLAWDLHNWLMTQLDEASRDKVERAQARALATLEARAARSSAATPHGLGWPSEGVARKMARQFANLLVAAAA